MNFDSSKVAHWLGFNFLYSIYLRQGLKDKEFPVRTTRITFMRKILIVDDDTDLLEAMKYFLKTRGYDVAVTISCDEALLILDCFKPDLIFLDTEVGSQDGRTTCYRIRAQAEYQHIPIILISANHEALKSYQEFGANAFIKKPFQLSTLLNTLQNH